MLGQGGVHEHVRIGECQLSGEPQLRFARGHRETRRDGVVEAPLAVPAFYELAHVAANAFRCIPEVLGTVAIHHHLARRHAHLASLGGGEEGIGRGAMHGAEDHRRRRSVAQQLVQEKLGDLLGVGTLREARFLGKGVLLEPVQEVAAGAGDDVGLRVMDVRIDEAGKDQRRAAVDDIRVARQRCEQRLRRAQASHPPILDDEQPVFEVLEAVRRGGDAGVVPEMQDRSAESAHVRGGHQASMRAARRARHP